MKKKPSPKKRKKTSKKQNTYCCFFKKDLGIVIKIALFLSIILIFLAVYIAKADESVEPIVYFQGFESSVIDPAGGPPNNYNWFSYDFNSSFMAVRQALSGENGIISSTGDYHGVINKPLSFSNFSDSCVVDEPSHRWLTEIDVFLDTNWNLGAGFDYSIETRFLTPYPEEILKHYIFHVTRDTSTKKLLIGVSTETNYFPRENLEEFDNYIVKKSGWYTLRSKLRLVENTLVVDMLVLDSSKKVVWQSSLTKDDFSYDAASLSWNCKAEFSTIYDGIKVTNSDGFEVSNGFDLNIDNHKLILYRDLDVVGPPLTKEECLDDGWRVFDWQTFSEPTFKSQGDCVSYIESSINADGNSDF